MKIAIACDHRGFTVKQRIVAQISDRGHEVVDFGTDNPKACDYPDFAIPAAKAVALGQVDRGILIDGSGIGMSIIANKLPNIRAAICPAAGGPAELPKSAFQLSTQGSG